MTRHLKTSLTILYAAARRYLAKETTLLAAALAFYALLSLAPMGVISLSITTLVVEPEQGERTLGSLLRHFGGPTLQQTVMPWLRQATLPDIRDPVTALAFLALLFAATRLIYQLHRALNLAWDIRVERRPKRLFKLIKKRAWAIGITLLIGVVLLVSTAFRTMLAWVTTAAETFLPARIEAVSPVLAATFDSVFSLGILSLVFVLAFRVIPDQRLPWRSLWVGACLASVLCWFAGYLLAAYLLVSKDAGPYAALGSIFVVLLWLHLSAQGLLFGAHVAYELHRVKSGRDTP